MAKFRIPDDMISEHQKKVEEVFLEKSVNIMMRALAGSGKTTMLKHLASFRKASQRMAYLAFNKKNAVEGAKKLPREVASLTTHAFCGRWLRDNMKMPQRQDSGKNYQIMEKVYPLIDRHNKARKRVRSASFKLLSLAKHYACRPGDMGAIKAVMDKYTFDLESDGEIMTVVENVSEALHNSLPGKFDGMIFNYDDMLWWPIILGLDPPKYDVLLADEVQDFNSCQIEIVQRMMDSGCRVIAVGDPYQAVYRFRGADNKAFGRLADTLANGKVGCEELVLPTNYRCGKAHIRYVQEHTVVKEIEAAPTALEGKVECVTYDGLLDLLAADLLS
jgi:superfamily I DNA/RNA helicase